MEPDSTLVRPKAMVSIRLVGAVAAVASLVGCSFTGLGNEAEPDAPGPTSHARRPDRASLVPFPDVVVLGTGRGARLTGDLTTPERDSVANTRWRVLDPTADLEPYYAGSDTFVSLTMEGGEWRVRDCGLDLRAAGTLTDRIELTGDWHQVEDPDPGAACAAQPNASGWMEFLGSRPVAHRAGNALVLSRTEGISTLDPGDLLPVPVAVDAVDVHAAAATAGWAQAVGSGGPVYDYDPLASPEDAVERADLVVAGDVLRADPPTGSAGDQSVTLTIRVTEVIWGNASTGQEVPVKIAVGPTALDAIREAPQPAGPVVAVLVAGDGSAYVSFVDGLWLQGPDRPVSTHAELQSLPDGWRYRDTVESITADLRHAARRAAH
jgi:hypothetical protein